MLSVPPTIPIPLVSVLVTVYNREAYLGDCLNSILASTWQDFEVVVVDDQSNDGSWEVAGAVAARDSRVRLIRNERNLGDYPNRNRASEQARGVYLKYVDADDLIYPHGLEVMVKAMQANPAAALGLSWNQIDPPVPYPFQTDAKEVIRRHYLGKSLLGCGPTGAIIRRDAFEELGGFSGRQFVGDSELWLKLAERWPVVVLPPALVWWRQHEGQQMQLELTRPQILTHRFHLQVQALRATVHLNACEKDGALSRMQQHHARRILAMAIRLRKPFAAWRLCRDSGLGVSSLVRGLFPYV